MMNCPKCDRVAFEVLKDTVDIGVGEQEFIIGGECANCGPLEFCNYCGAWETKDGLEHTKWCKEKN